MKAVALNASRLKFPGERKHARALRHFCVERGIKTCRLRKPGKMLLGEADDGQGWWRMQRCKGGGRLKLLQHCSIDQAMLPQLWSAMHDSMPDGIRRRHF